MAVGNSAAAAIEAVEAIAVTWKALPAVVETEKAEIGPSKFLNRFITSILICSLFQKSTRVSAIYAKEKLNVNGKVNWKFNPLSLITINSPLN